MGAFDKFERELSAPIPSVRIFALETLIGSQLIDHSVLPILKKYRAHETDEECLMLYDYAIRSFASDEVDSLYDAKDFTPEDFWRKFVSFSAIEKLGALNKLRRKEIKAAVQGSKSVIQSESHPAVLRKLISLTGPFFPAEDASFFIPYLSFPSVGVRIAALNLLIQKSPDSVVGSLPKLLRSKDPNLRALAIRCLFKIDQAGAMQYFEHFLFKGTDQDKKSILANSIFFDFDKIKTQLVKFLFIEQNHELLNDASLLLINNPDPGVAQQLLLNLTNSTQSIAGRKKFIEAVLDECCRQIDLHGAGAKHGKSFRAHLEDWKNNTLVSREVVLDINVLIKSDFSDSSLIDKISEKLGNEAYFNAVKRYLKHHDSELVIARLTDILKAAESSAQKADFLPHSIVDVDSESFPTDFARQDMSQKVRFISTISKKSLAKHDEKLASLFADSDVDKQVIIACLKLYKRHKSDKLLCQARQAVKDASPGVVAVALEYLAYFDHDWFISVAARYLKHDERQVKRAAVKALRNISVDKALVGVNLMLKTRIKEQILNALACMIYFDFNFVRGIAAEVIKSAGSEDILDAALMLFLNNPELDNLYPLYCLEQAAPSDKWKEKIAHTRKQNTGFLVSIGLLDESRMQSIEERYAADYAEQLRAQQRFHSCRASNTIELGQAQQLYFFVKDRLSDAWQMPGDQLIRLVIGWAKRPRNFAAMVLVFSIIWVMAALGQHASQPDRTGGAVAARPVIVSGKVKQVSQNRILLSDSSGQIIILKPLRGVFAKGIKESDSITVRIAPVRLNRNNELLAVCLD